MRGGTACSAAGCIPLFNAQLPVLQVTVNKTAAKALLDTGYSKSIVSRVLVGGCPTAESA